MRSSRWKAALFVLLPLGCDSEDPEFVAWAEKAADAICACPEADNPRDCALDIPEDLSVAEANLGEKVAKWKGKGGEKSSAALQRASACDSKVNDWMAANPRGAKPLPTPAEDAPEPSASAAPSTAAAATAAAPTPVAQPARPQIRPAAPPPPRKAPKAPPRPPAPQPAFD